MSSATASVNKGGFIFGDTKDEGPNKVLGLMPIETYLVQYTDGASKKCVRLVFKVPGSPESFLLQEKIQGAFVATTGTEWFNRALNARLENKAVESV
jgi:hypothetical protein